VFVPKLPTPQFEKPVTAPNEPDDILEVILADQYPIRLVSATIFA